MQRGFWSDADEVPDQTLLRRIHDELEGIKKLLDPGNPDVSLPDIQPDHNLATLLGNVQTLRLYAAATRYETQWAMAETSSITPESRREEEINFCYAQDNTTTQVLRKTQVALCKAERDLQYKKQREDAHAAYLAQTL